MLKKIETLYKVQKKDISKTGIILANAFQHDPVWKKVLEKSMCNFLLVSFTSDLLYTPVQMRELALTMMRSKKPVTYANIPSNAGHEAFLLETQNISRVIESFLKGVEE